MENLNIERDPSITSWDSTYQGKWYVVEFVKPFGFRGKDNPTAIVKEHVAKAYHRKIQAFKNKMVNECSVISVKELQGENPNASKKKEKQEEKGA